MAHPKRLACVALLLAVSAAAGVEPTRPASVSKEEARVACFRQQAAIGRGMRAFNVEARKPQREVGDLGFFQALVRAGLLDDVPVDPGFGAGSYGHYRYRRAGNGVTCYHHGDPDVSSSSERQACFGQQKVLAEAIESWTREQGTPPAARVVGTKKFFDRLVAEGHLEALPSDPGQGRESYRNYRMSSSPGAGLECAVHGAPLPEAASSAENCFRVQAAIAQAVSRFNAERNVVRTDVGNRAFFHMLVREGYLPALPEDPGQGPETSEHFRYCEDGNRVECVVHGRPPATAFLPAPGL